MELWNEYSQRTCPAFSAVALPADMVAHTGLLAAALLGAVGAKRAARARQRAVPASPAARARALTRQRVTRRSVFANARVPACAAPEAGGTSYKKIIQSSILGCYQGSMLEM